MATTIRVYLDGGTEPYASADMLPDRTFAVSLLSVPGGTHTFEVTAQEDGKGESARVIQTVEVDRGAQQTHPLLADVSATAAVLADLTAPGAPTQHALAASISCAATVAADLTVSANTSLEAAISASATTAADLTAPGPGGSYVFSDDFTGTDGSAPNAAKWTIYDSTVTPPVGGGLADIQGNTLRLAAKTGGTGIAKKAVLSPTITGLAHVYEFDYTAISAGASLYPDVCLLGSAYALTDVENLNRMLVVRMTSATAFEVSCVGYKNIVNSNVYTETLATGTVTAGGPYHGTITIPASGQISVTVKGVTVQCTYSWDDGVDGGTDPFTTANLAEVLGADAKILLRYQNGTTADAEMRIDNLTVT